MKTIKISLLLITIFSFSIFCINSITNLSAFPEEKIAKERFTGEILSGEYPSQLIMEVDRWTTSEESRQLFEVLTEEGDDAMRKAMRKTTKGYAWLEGQVKQRWYISIASSQQTESGRQITLIAKYPIFFKMEQQLTFQWDEYFGVIKFTLNEKGEGEGHIIDRVTIGIDEDGIIGFKPWGSAPVMLKRVKRK